MMQTSVHSAAYPVQTVYFILGQSSSPPEIPLTTYPFNNNVQPTESPAVKSLLNLAIPESAFIMYFCQSEPNADICKIRDDHSKTIVDPRVRRFHIVRHGSNVTVTPNGKSSMLSVCVDHMISMHKLLLPNCVFVCLLPDLNLDFPRDTQVKMSNIIASRKVVLALQAKDIIMDSPNSVLGNGNQQLPVIEDLHAHWLTRISEEHKTLFHQTLLKLVFLVKALPENSIFNPSKFPQPLQLGSLPFSPLLLLNCLIRGKVLIPCTSSMRLVYVLNKSALPGFHSSPLKTTNHPIQSTNPVARAAVSPKPANSKKSSGKTNNKAAKPHLFYAKLLAFCQKHDQQISPEFPTISTVPVDMDSNCTISDEVTSYGHLSKRKSPDEFEESHFDFDDEDDDDCHFIGELSKSPLKKHKTADDSRLSFKERLKNFVKYHFPSFAIDGMKCRTFKSNSTADLYEGYRSQLVIGDEMFESCRTQSSPQAAEEDSSRMALQYFNAFLEGALQTGRFGESDRLCDFLKAPVSIKTVDPNTLASNMRKPVQLTTPVVTQPNIYNNSSSIVSSQPLPPPNGVKTEMAVAPMSLLNDYTMKCNVPLPEFVFHHSRDKVHVASIKFFDIEWKTIKAHPKKMDAKNDIATQVLLRLGKKLKNERELKFSKTDFE